MQTALNAVWGVMAQFGGATDPANPGPGDFFDEIAPRHQRDRHRRNAKQRSAVRRPSAPWPPRSG
ncbi:hypothetical protein [Streptomyces sp. NPDC086010]|uniref:hypothetical protein n=1 Tax=Streptomyces sp. NPDC086010 TaxID=3365745 RepID=UPI0037CFC9B8